MPSPYTELGYVDYEEYIKLLKEADLLLKAGAINQTDYDTIKQGTKDNSLNILAGAYGTPEGKKTLKPIGSYLVGEPGEGYVFETSQGRSISIPGPYEEDYDVKPTSKIPPAIITPESKINEAITKAAKKATKTSPDTTIQEQAKNIRSDIEFKRSPSGLPRPLPPMEPLEYDKPATGFLDAIKPQQIMFDDQYKQMQGSLGETLTSALAYKQRSKDGVKIVEAFPAWAGRMIGIPLEAVIGTAEAALSPMQKNLGLTIADRIKKGRGLAGAVQDISEYTTREIFGASPETAKAVGDKLWWLGLFGDLYLPIDLGLSDLAIIAKARRDTQKVKKAFPENEVAQNISGFGKADTIGKRAVVNYARNQDNINKAADYIDLKAQKEIDKASEKKISSFEDQYFINDEAIELAVLSAFKSAAKNPQRQREIAKLADELIEPTSKLAGLPEALLKKTEGLDEATAEGKGSAVLAVSQELLKLSGQKQLSLLDDIFKDPKSLIRIDDFLVPANVVKKESEAMRLVLEPIEAFKQAKENGKITIQPEFFQRNPSLYQNFLNVRSSKLKREAFGKATRNEITEPITLTIEEFNNAVEKSVKQRLKNNTLASPAETLSPTQKAKLGEKESELFRQATTQDQTRLDKIVGGLKRIIPSFQRKLTSEERLTPKQKESLEKAQQQLNSLPNSFEAQVRKRMKDGASRQDAFAQTIFEGYLNPANYIRSAKVIVEEYPKEMRAGSYGGIPTPKKVSFAKKRLKFPEEELDFLNPKFIDDEMGGLGSDSLTSMSEVLETLTNPKAKPLTISPISDMTTRFPEGFNELREWARKHNFTTRIYDEDDGTKWFAVVDNDNDFAYNVFRDLTGGNRQALSNPQGMGRLGTALGYPKDKVEYFVSKRMKNEIPEPIRNYSELFDVFTDPTGILPPKTKTELIGDLFDDFVATIYGAEEKIIKGRALETGKDIIRKGLDPESFRTTLNKLLAASPKNSLFRKAKDEFTRIYSEEGDKAALEYLGKLHKFLQDKPLAKLNPEMEIALSGMEEIVPVIKSDNFIPAISYAWLNRKASDIAFQASSKVKPKIIEDLAYDIVDETIFDIQSNLFKDNPLLIKNYQYKSSELIQEIFDNPKTTEAIAKAIRTNKPSDVKEVVKAIENVISDQPTDDLRKAITDTFMDKIAYARSQADVVAKGFEIGMVADVVKQTPETLKKQEEILYEFGKKNPARNILRSVSDFYLGIGTKPTKESVEAIKATKTGSTIYNALQSSRNLAQAGRTLDSMKVIPKTDIIPDVVRTEGTTIEDLVNEIASMDLKPRQNSIINRVFGTNQTLGEKATETLSAVGNVAKSGMLAGAYVPNFAYHAQNILSAPRIILSTLGPKAALQSLVDLVFFDPRVNGAVDELFGNRFGANSVIRLESGKSPGTFTNPAGKVYTPESVAKLIAENNIQQTADALSLSRNVIKEFAKWSGKTLSGEDVGIAKQFLREFDPSKPNVWFEVANYFDTRFRTGVLVRSLAEGKSEQEAIKAARESLFDYSKMTDIEKNLANTILWFWSFERASITQTAKNLINTPKRFLIEQKTKGVPNDEKYHSAISDYRENSEFLGLIKDNKQDYYLYGQTTPQADSTARMIDYLGTLAPLLNLDVAQAGENVVRKGISRASASPFVSGIASIAGFEINKGTFSDPTNYVDPRILGLLRLNEGAFQAFKTYVKLEPIPKEDMDPRNITIDGIAYRIPYTDKQSRKNYDRILLLAQTLGAERAIKDYASAFIGEEPGEYTPLSLEVDDATIEFLKNIGVIKIEPFRSGDQVESEVREKVIREIGER